jgi:Uma2 family endonuclease
MVVTLKLQPTLELTDEQFEQICNSNRDLKFERTARGGLVVMAFTGGETGERNAELNGQLWLWNRQTHLGHLYDSSRGVRLPNGAIRSPDAAWFVRPVGKLSPPHSGKSGFCSALTLSWN